MKEKRGVRIMPHDTVVGQHLHLDPAGEDLVIILPGRSEATAMEENYEEAKRILASLELDPPRNIALVSGGEVYGSDAGEEIGEDHHPWADTKVGQSLALAEKEVEKWCAAHGVVLTVLRPATVFGNGMTGWAADMFTKVVRGEFVAIRGEEGRVSAVLAEDVARAAVHLLGNPGVFNLSDGNVYSYPELAEAMTANAGAMKRMIYLPEKWAVVISGLLGKIPFVKSTIGPEVRANRKKKTVLSNAKAVAAGCKFGSVAEKLMK